MDAAKILQQFQIDLTRYFHQAFLWFWVWFPPPPLNRCALCSSLFLFYSNEIVRAEDTWSKAEVKQWLHRALLFFICVVASSSTTVCFTEHISNISDLQFEKLTSYKKGQKVNIGGEGGGIGCDLKSIAVRQSLLLSYVWSKNIKNIWRTSDTLVVKILFNKIWIILFQHLTGWFFLKW